MKAWAAKYKDAGLVVLGVHTPEFTFERDPENVKTAVADLKVTYPIPIDSNRMIWTSFRNEYWPANYVIDAKGRIRYHHFGEGDYDKSQQVIRALLEENGASGLDESTMRVAGEGPEAPPSSDVRSPETYVGYARSENFASPEGSRATRARSTAHRRASGQMNGARRIVEGRRRIRQTRIGARQDRIPVS